MNLQLKQWEIISIDGDARGVILLCLSGEIWLTQQGDPDDHVLSPGIKFTISRKGKIVLYSFAPSALSLESREKEISFTADTRESHTIIDQILKYGLLTWRNLIEQFRLRTD